MIKCNYTVCLYNNKNHCLSKTVCISDMGVCDMAFIIDIPEKELDIYKRKMLERLHVDPAYKIKNPPIGWRRKF